MYEESRGQIEGTIRLVGATAAVALFMTRVIMTLMADGLVLGL